MLRSLVPSSLSARLVAGMVALIIATTLSAGVPAYLLTRSQLEQQAWQQVVATERSTASLYAAAQSRLDDLTQLLSERPTLRQLILEGDAVALGDYLAAFQVQSDLDFVQVCAPQSVASGIVATTEPSGVPCPAQPLSGTGLARGEPYLLSSYPVLGLDGSPANVVAGVRIDEAFLSQLSSNTGVEQSILGPDSTVLVSTLDAPPAGQPELPYFRAASLLQPSAGSPSLVAEVALPVAELRQTERNALFILFASTGLVTLLGILLGTWYVRRQTEPLHSLTAVAERISSGELTAAIPEPSGPQEIATLSAALSESQATMLQALDERSQARDWLNGLVQSINEGVITFDTRGRITFMSQGAERMTGWTSEEAIGRPVNDVLELADPAGHSFLDRIPPSGEKREIEIRARTGKPLVVATTGARLIPPNSDTIQVALVLRDVTEEQAVRNLRSFFLANISHEFRTPLSTLSASMELLLDELEDLSPAEIRQLLKPSYLSLTSLQTLIDNLLESSSIEAGSFTLRMRPFEVGEMVNEALSIVRPQVERRRQTVVVTEPARLPVIVADPARLTQALVNLLVNASKYGPGDQPIDLEISQTADGLCFAVADRGPGIRPNDRGLLFRRFVRLPATDNEQYGIGLGLYLVKRIAEAHGGTVETSDRQGGGAVFRLYLPAEAVERTA